jgi:chromosome segregation protein
LVKTKSSLKETEKQVGKLVVVHAKKVRDLEEENINRETEIKNLSEKSITLTETLNDTRQNLRSVESTKNSLEIQVFNLKNEKEQLVNRIQILEEQRRTITRDYQQIARKCQAYEEIEAAIQERLARNATIADPKDIKLSGQEETIELQKALIAKKAIDIKDLKETIRILSHSYQKLLEHKEDLDEEIKDFAERLENKETKLQKLTTDYRSFKKAKEEVDEELTYQKENYSELENKLQKVNTSFDRIQNELDDWKGIISTLEEELIQKNRKLHETKQSLESLQMLAEVPSAPQSEPK